MLGDLSVTGRGMLKALLMIYKIKYDSYHTNTDKNVCICMILSYI